MADSKLSALAQESTPALADFTYVIDAGPTSQKQSLDRVLGLLTLPMQGRLTTETGVPVSSSDRTSQGTLFYTPYLGKIVTLYDGTRWRVYSTAEISLALTVTSGKNYDVFLFDNAGTVTIELSAAWTDDLTRADALAAQDGVQVKSSAHTRRWVGTIRASGTNLIEDSKQNRLVYNAYNQVARQGYVQSSSSHTYGSATTRSWNNDATLQVSVIAGAAMIAMLGLSADFQPSGNANPVVRGVLDWTSGSGAGYDEVFLAVLVTGGFGLTRLLENPVTARAIPLGYHYIRLTEEDDTALTDTFNEAGLTVVWLI